MATLMSVHPLIPKLSDVRLPVRVTPRKRPTPPREETLPPVSVPRLLKKFCAAKAGVKPKRDAAAQRELQAHAEAAPAHGLSASAATAAAAATNPGSSAPAVHRDYGFEWSVASRALPGQVVSGDLHVVAPFEHGALFGVVDGLGHGAEATEAALVAVQVLARHAGEPVVNIVERCHIALQRTRGVVMSLVAIDRWERTLTSVGVGDVETVLFRANPRVLPQRESVLLRGGVVGYQLPRLQPHVVPIEFDDLVVFATDGVREDFADTVIPADPVAQIVERVITQKFRGTDDGLVLALKYVGKS